MSNISVMKRSVFIGLFALLTLSGFKAFCQRSGSEEFKQAFLERINKVRSTGCTCGTTYMPPVAPLTWNNTLEKAATGHAWDMSNNNYFSHTSKDGRTMEDRIVKAGYQFNGFKNFAVGENIAYGQMNIDEVMKGWLKSPGHCMNLMNAMFKEIGVAEDHNYWVQDFGFREPFSAQEQQLIKSGRMHVVHVPAKGD
jgi:uncharacterized protein YkwD